MLELSALPHGWMQNRLSSAEAWHAWLAAVLTLLHAGTVLLVTKFKCYLLTSIDIDTLP